MKKLLILVLSVAAIYGCEEIVSVPDISEEMIEVLAPLDGTILYSDEVTFSWNQIDFADRYQIQVAEPTFALASQIALDTILGDSLQSIRSFSKSLLPGSYQWRVRGLNSNYSTDYNTQSFIVDTIGGEDPFDISDEELNLLAPSDGLVINDTNVTFSWESASEATSYSFQIARPDFENPEELVVNTSFDTVGNQSFTLEDNTSYQWRVKAINETSETAYTTRDLSVNVTEDLSEQEVVIVAPEDGFETSDTSIMLSWEPLEQATLYRVIITDVSDNSFFLEQTSTESTLTVAFEVGSYTWAVRGENDAENTPYTEQTITIIE